MKMASNQKMQENKPTLKFNFTIKKGDQFQNFHFDILTEPYCPSLSYLLSWPMQSLLPSSTTWTPNWSSLSSKKKSKILKTIHKAVKYSTNDYCVRYKVRYKSRYIMNKTTIRPKKFTICLLSDMLC